MLSPATYSWKDDVAYALSLGHSISLRTLAKASAGMS